MSKDFLFDCLSISPELAVQLLELDLSVLEFGFALGDVNSRVGNLDELQEAFLPNRVVDDTLSVCIAGLKSLEVNDWPLVTRPVTEIRPEFCVQLVCQLLRFAGDVVQDFVELLGVVLGKGPSKSRQLIANLLDDVSCMSLHPPQFHDFRDVTAQGILPFVGVASGFLVGPDDFSPARGVQQLVHAAVDVHQPVLEIFDDGPKLSHEARHESNKGFGDPDLLTLWPRFNKSLGDHILLALRNLSARR
mmetsp:Transcript_9175/g.20297  ORF Transcript_9175/g.20297 Transcript_9175/m.20297 type:complete len:247 (-) Transcript_9175:543-1283(-)